MTLQQVIKAFEMVASQQPSVNMIVQNDIFRLNSKSDARYGVFGWTQGQHSSSADSSFFTFSFCSLEFLISSSKVNTFASIA